MNEVSNQTELQTALNNRIETIYIAASFEINRQINIQYPVTLTSTNNQNFTLSKSNSYASYMFRIINNGALSLTNITLDGNSQNHPIDDTTNRSLLYVTGGTLNINNGTILQNNNSYGDGGSIFVSGSLNYANQFNITGSNIIRNCWTKTNGGGINVTFRNPADSFSLSGNTIIENNNAAYGGGIYIRVSENGAGTTILIQDNTQITGNTASRYGGGIAIINNTNNTVPLNTTISNQVVISNNQAESGAGIYFNSTVQNETLTLSNQSSVTDNKSTSSGSGIYLLSDAYANLNITTSFIRNNISDGNGGGIFFSSSDGGSITLQQTDVSKNQAINSNTGSGGGLWVSNRSTTTPLTTLIDQSTFQENSGLGNGGAILYGDYGPNGTLTIQNNSTFVKNSAGGNAGGIQIATYHSITTSLDNITIDANTGNQFGGGLYFVGSSTNPSTLTINHCTITNNVSDNQGGGCRIASSSQPLTTTINDSIIEHNTCNSNSGGGIWIGGSSHQTTISGTTTINANESISGNGGGIYFNSTNGTLTLQDQVGVTNNKVNRQATNFGNHGGGICLVPGNIFIKDNVEIANNNALYYGGGISMTSESTLEMTGGSIHDNTTDGLGGGIYTKDSTVTLKRGSIHNNHAKIGGAIWNGSDSNNQ